MIINVGITNFGIGNLRSLLQSLKGLPLDFNIHILDKPSHFIDIDKLILPGQGSCLGCLNQLKEYDLIYYLYKFAKTKSVLGICVGKHLFFQKTHEGNVDILNIFPGIVKKFKSVKVPHIGWNKVAFIKNHFIFNNIKNFKFFYFAHSYYSLPSQPENIYAITNYNFNFSAIYIKNNIVLFQFHPEKSLNWGLRLIYNFFKWNWN